jgi:hypothetical protein
MTIELGSRLIWQSNSPAPFESAWSIFAKLMALNGQKPDRIASFIADSGYRRSLRFRDSSWINIARFSTALGVDQARLRQAFLDQLGFNMKVGKTDPWRGRGIKICVDCLKKGYHCVFFELGFVDICPWHKKKLESPCFHCSDAVTHLGLLAVKNNNNQTTKENNKIYSSEWGEWHSSCNHIYFNDGQVGKLNELSTIEEKIIVSSCLEFLSWWKGVSKNSGISDYLLSNAYTDEKPAHLNKYFNAAENIAGPCPWPVEQLRQPIRCQSWMQHGKESDYPSDRVPRKSAWDMVYRTIRRHIFNRYVSKHRVCWNELNHYSHDNSQQLDSDTVCPVALAYAAWRLSIEHLPSLEALDFVKFRDRPINLMRLSPPEFSNSVKSHASLLYVYFFHIWEEILQHTGKENFALWNSVFPDLDEKVAAMYISEADISDGDWLHGEWSLIFPDYKNLERQSFISCCGKYKQEYRMIFSFFENELHDTDSHQRVNYGTPIFKIKKSELGSRKTSYQYINI